MEKLQHRSMFGNEIPTIGDSRYYHSYFAKCFKGIDGGHQFAFIDDFFHFYDS